MVREPTLVIAKRGEKSTMQAKSKLLNGYNVLRHRTSTRFSKQREKRGKLGKGYGYNPRKVCLKT